MGTDPTLPLSAEAQAALDDTLAKTRTMPIPEPASIQTAPDSYTPTNPTVRRTRLRKLAKNLEAEGDVLLQTCAAKGAKLKQELGEQAPTAQEAQNLIDRAARVRGSRARAERLAAYLGEQEEILNSDIVLYAEKVHKEASYVSQRNPQIKEDYKAVFVLIDTRKDAIKQGMARAKKNKPAK